MKYTGLTILLIFFALFLHAQKDQLESLQRSYQEAKTDTARIILLSRMGDVYAQNRPDSELILAQRSLLMSRQAKFTKGQQLALKQMAEAYQFMGNYPLALQYYLQRLKLDEENPDPEREVVTLLSISNLYDLEGDYTQALVYARKADTVIQNNKLESYQWYSYIGFGNLYEKLNDIAKAQDYNLKAYRLAAAQKNNGWMGMSLNNLGNTYLKANEFGHAWENYQRAIPFLIEDNNQNFLCEAYQGLSSVLFHAGKLDSSILFAKTALKTASDASLDHYYLLACQLLTDLYKAKGIADSALMYQGRLVSIKDSLYSQERIKQVESLTIAEKLRQEERQQEMIQEEKERAHKLSLLFVGLLIPLFFIISMVLSKRKVKRRFIELSGILSLLLFFEYLTLLLHPAISNLTNHSPFLEIIILVIIASILTPTHHRLEHWLLHKLTTNKSHIVPPTITTGNEPSPDSVEQMGTEEKSAPAPPNNKK